jgi:hypothetical protein
MTNKVTLCHRVNSLNLGCRRQDTKTVQEHQSNVIKYVGLTKRLNRKVYNMVLLTYKQCILKTVCA